MLGNEFSTETSVQHATSLLLTHGQNVVIMTSSIPKNPGLFVFDKNMAAQGS